MAEGDNARYVPALRFAWLTPAYDVSVAATTREKVLIPALVLQRVLDLGCGTGTLAIEMARRCPQASFAAAYAKGAAARGFGMALTGASTIAAFGIAIVVLVAR